MIGSIVYYAGIALAILAVLDIFKKPISLVGKIICSIVVLALSWLGFALYFLWAKDKITKWFK